MNAPKCDEYGYIQWLLAAQTNYTCTEFEQVAPTKMAHDAPTRMLKREKLTPRILWKNAKPHVDKTSGYLITDDSVIDKPHTKDLDLARWQYSGTHHDVVKGIGLASLLWTSTDGTEHLPVDYRLYNPTADGKSKNQHLQDMLYVAANRGFEPEYVLMDSWYTSLDNLKTCRKLGWHWMGQLRKNRIVSPQPHQQTNLEKIDISPEGTKVYLKGYGFIKVFKTASEHGRVDYYGTSNLDLTASDVERVYGKRWQIEEYHRGLKQQCGIAKCQARTDRSQRNHIWCAIHSFLLLEIHRLNTGVTWQQAKLSIVRDAIQQYLLDPRFNLKLATA